MAENLPVGRRERLVRPYDRIRRTVALRLEYRPGQIRPAAGLHPLRHPFGRMDLRHVLQYDLRRIRQRGTPDRLDPLRLLGREFRTQTVPSPNTSGMETYLARRSDGTLHGRHYPERRFRMVFLERIRRTVQLHRRRLPGLYQRSGRQHHGVLSGRSALRRRAAADRRMHLAAVQTGDPPCRGVRHLAMESGRIARLPAAHPGLLPAPAVQHPIPAKRQHLCQRAASHRSLQVLRRIYEERTQLSAVLPDPTAERGRSQRTRDLRECRRQSAPHSRQPGYAAPQHRADHHREHERLVHAAFRLSGRDHAPPGLSLQNGDRVRTVFRHR